MIYFEKHYVHVPHFISCGEAKFLFGQGLQAFPRATRQVGNVIVETARHVGGEDDEERQAIIDMSGVVIISLADDFTGCNVSCNESPSVRRTKVIKKPPPRFTRDEFRTNN